MNLQPNLANKLVRLKPLEKDDFENLFIVASDPLIWEQHPNNDRYKRDVFESFFEKAMDTKGAFLIIDKCTDKTIGSSRFYDLDSTKSTIVIGFTFIARSYWGTNYNRSIKKLMLDYAFQYVNKVHFHVAKNNFRSQKAMSKLGGTVIDYSTSNLGIEGNPIYEIKKSDWSL
ncbi:GNAT family N-acetyltransferase [Flavobacterium jejuense]|uniref:GNAT family N-acetyltransferase n=1 Tax=Flavobacterium jejuense TaxID=1544455 RepID=A0ABX0IT08_9FLAO|nr:GNAT family N-acetyltransferase [Flavobacterium jejuense]NHN26245.1 GNAT family N-acetyltransferase [Flavobacterium jejuense]